MKSEANSGVVVCPSCVSDRKHSVIPTLLCADAGVRELPMSIDYLNGVLYLVHLTEIDSIRERPLCGRLDDNFREDCGSGSVLESPFHFDLMLPWSEVCVGKLDIEIARSSEPMEIGTPGEWLARALIHLVAERLEVT